MAASVKKLSGTDWVKFFPDAGTTAALADAFRTGCENFIAAMRAGGAVVTISSTRRPTERAYLMFYCWKIHLNTDGLATIPAKPGVDIDWVHRKPDGSIDLAKSQQAATAMVNGYGIAFPPALNSRHVVGLAIDMSIAWTGALSIRTQAGAATQISSMPRDGFNLDLRKVGKDYGVIKHPSDAPHWSTDGK